MTEQEAAEKGQVLKGAFRGQEFFDQMFQEGHLVFLGFERRFHPGLPPVHLPLHVERGQVFILDLGLFDRVMGRMLRECHKEFPINRVGQPFRVANPPQG